MTTLSLPRALRLESARPWTVALVGAGGKTTAMFCLARELARSRPVWVTATSHLATWQIPLADRHQAIAPLPDGSSPTAMTWESAQAWIESTAGDSGVTLVTGPLVGDRTQPVPEGFLFWLHEKSRTLGIPLLIEADGSRRRPLKAPAEHEPPLPNWVDLVMVVAGMSGLGAPLDEDHVFRAQRFAALTGLRLSEPVSAEALTRFLLHPQGGLKNLPEGTRRLALLNQADTPDRQSLALRISRSLLPVYQATIVTSLANHQVHAVHERIAGIVLAAGQSRRFGQPKQLLEWHGKPFVRQVAETALQAGLAPVIVVTGAHAEAVTAALSGLEVHIVHNPDWPAGQGTSVACGVRALPSDVGGAVFLLADQPQIGPDVIHALVEAHAQHLSPILAPQVLEERHANPMLFDRVTFADLLGLQGDVGGRALLRRYSLDPLPWHDESLLWDVDTPEDYERLRSRAE